MKLDADLHNFGQKVTQEERASEIYFRKPRPVFWESFFFGKNSPLKNCFQNLSLSEVIFNLEVEVFDDHGGLSKIVSEVTESEISPSHAYSFGVLTAYSYIFGIRDLHKGNVMRTKTHLQVIDAEAVLSKILLPNETLLLPFKETTFNICAAKKSFNNPQSIDVENITGILLGYFDLFSLVIDSREKLLSIFDEQKEKMLKIPVRHIMRDTANYRKWREQQISPTVPLCQNELSQLERGDVPYFFKFIGDPTLYAYTSPTGDYEAVSVPVEFQKGVDRDAVSPDELLSASRLGNELLPTGSLFLLKKLLPHGFTGNIAAANFKAEITSSNFKIDFQDRIFTASAK